MATKSTTKKAETTEVAEAAEAKAPKVATGPVHDLVGRFIEVEELTCGDGCGREVSRVNGFAPGHDARLKSQLLKAGVLVSTDEGGFVITDDADDRWERWTKAMAILNG